MPLEFGVWRLDHALKSVEFSQLDIESRLEDILDKNISIASPNWCSTKVFHFDARVEVGSDPATNLVAIHRRHGLQHPHAGTADNCYVHGRWWLIGFTLLSSSGIGRSLFARTVDAAHGAGLKHIDATIGADSEPALAYYRAMGFVPYRETDGAIPHRYDL